MKTWLLIERKDKPPCMVTVTNNINIVKILERYNNVLSVTAYTIKRECRKQLDYLTSLKGWNDVYVY